MNNILVLRHAKTVCDPNTLKGQSEHKLEESAWDTIDTIVSKMEQREYDLKTIFTSDLNRAVQTATRVRDKLSLDIELTVDKRLREIDFGNLQGKTDEDLLAFSDATGDKYTTRYPSGESTRDVDRRVMSFYETAVKQSDGLSLVVTHTTPIYSFLSEFQDIKTTNVETKVHHCQLFDFRGSSISTLRPF